MHCDIFEKMPLKELHTWEGHIGFLIKREDICIKIKKSQIIVGDVKKKFVRLLIREVAFS